MRIVKTKLMLSDVLNTEHALHFFRLDPKQGLQPVLQQAVTSHDLQIAIWPKPGICSVTKPRYRSLEALRESISWLFANEE